jgi:hypothetical protein
MTKRVLWTKEEDEILVQAIKANPHNKQEAFREAASKLPLRDTISCQNRWYGILSNPHNKHYVGCLFTMIGRVSRLDNRNIYKDNSATLPIPMKVSMWTKIKKLLGLK